LACYNFENFGVHEVEQIWIIFCKDVAEKKALQGCFIFPPYPTNASTSTGETLKWKKLHLLSHTVYYCNAVLPLLV